MKSQAEEIGGELDILTNSEGRVVEFSLKV